MTLSKALDLIKKGDIQFVDLKFCDIRGTWQHMTATAHDFTEKNIVSGFGFDGSSIRGFNDIYNSDMLLKPDIETIFLDPFFKKTFSCICTIYDPITSKPFGKDPRYTAMKAEKYLLDSKIGDVSYWGPEIEFFVFDVLNVELSQYRQVLEMEQRELPGDDFTARAVGDGYKIPVKCGYFPVPPFDKLQKYRSEVVSILESLGVEIEFHHHEVATAGQIEIDMKYDSLLKMADKVLLYKYVARNVAHKYGMVAVFLPKPVYGDNGSGMHVHQSIFKKNRNIFYEKSGYAQLSDTALSYAAGLLQHVNAILGITNPTVNSYRRLVPHFEAPTSIAFSARNRSAAVRIPMYFKNNEKAKRLEFRCPDPTCNPYLGFAAQLVAGIEGVKKNLDPIKMKLGPYEENIWEMNNIPQTPKTIFESLDALEKNTTFIASGVFTKELMESYLGVKRQEATQALMYPTPSDFFHYGDI